MIARGPESYATRKTDLHETRRGILKKALVVGINGYGFPNDLPSAVRDAEAFANVLDTIVASMLQGRAYQQPYGGGFSPFGQGAQGGQGWPGAQGQGWWQGGFGGFQSPYAQGAQSFHGYPGQQGANLQPHEIAQIVSAVTPLVVSLLQSRNYQGHFGQFLPRAA
jgi:hypothetical protein